MEPGLVSYLVVFLIILFSSFIHSSAAFGFSVFAMTLLPLILPLISASAIVKVALFLLTAMMMMNLRRHINIRFISIPIAASVLGNSIGFYLLMTVNADLLKRVLGVILVLVGLYLVFYNGIRIKRSITAGIAMGFIAGVLNGLFNLAGVVLVIYYFSALEDKLEYAASLQATFFVTIFYGLVLNFVYGVFSHPGMFEYTLITTVAVLLGCFFGLKVLKIMKKQTIGKLSYIYMIIMGTIMAVNLETLLG